MKTKKNRLKLLKNNLTLLVMLMPAVLYVFIFNYLPNGSLEILYIINVDSRGDIYK